MFSPSNFSVRASPNGEYGTQPDVTDRARSDDENFGS